MRSPAAEFMPKTADDKVLSGSENQINRKTKRMGLKGRAVSVAAERMTL